MSNMRFEFGKNWAKFLEKLNEERIIEAEKSLKEKLGVESLQNKTFLDVGSGSGIFSLAAYRLGANVVSFDFDSDSVACTNYLKSKYAANENRWTVNQGSILDAEYLKSFTQFDVVYSWGVLHHTGNMHQAFANIAKLVKPHGILFISIYNDQGGASKRWKWIKNKYNNAGVIGKKILIAYTLLRQWTLTFIKDFIKTGNPLKTWFSYGTNNRGMSAYHDVIDWVGGYPFEVAKPEEVFEYFNAKHGFTLGKLKTCAGGIGCNEFVFVNSRPNHV